MTYCDECGVAGGAHHMIDCSYNPITRAARRHEILCHAVDRQFENAGGALSADKIVEIVRRAQLAADLAYPPPKAAFNGTAGKLVQEEVHPMAYVEPPPYIEPKFCSECGACYRSHYSHCAQYSAFTLK
jgi:hypothetical protein